MALGCIVHWCTAKPYNPDIIVLRCQAIERIHSNKLLSLPPPGWRQGPSNSRQRAHHQHTGPNSSYGLYFHWCVIAITHISQVRIHLCRLAGCPLETGAALFLEGSPFVITLLCNSYTCACKTEVGLPCHFLLSSPWLHQTNYTVPHGVYGLSQAGLIAECFLLTAETLASTGGK